MSAIVAIIFISSACFAIYFCCLRPKNKNAELPETCKKFYPRDRSSPSSYQTASLQRQGKDCLYGEYQNPIHGSQDLSNSQGDPRFMHHFGCDSPLYSGSCSISRNARSAEDSQRHRYLDDGSIDGSPYCGSTSGRTFIEVSREELYHLQKLGHTFRGESPYAKRLPARSRGGRSVEGSSRRHTPIDEYCEETFDHPHLFDRCDGGPSGEISPMNRHPSHFNGCESSQHPPPKLNSRSTGYFHKRQQSDNCRLHDSPEPSRQRGNRAASVPLCDRRSSSRLQPSRPGQDRHMERTEAEHEDPMDSKLEKAIDSHDGYQEGRI